MLNMPKSLLLACCLVFAAMPAFAQSVRAGDITVHYNALATSQLSPDVTRQYGITRSTSRALLNVAVRQGDPGKDKAVAAKVTASAVNAAGARQLISVREVKEGDAVSYLGEARIQGNDTLRFEIEVTPTDGGKPIRATFRQEFFIQ